MSWNEKELFNNILRNCQLYLLACKIVFPEKNEAASLASFKTAAKIVVVRKSPSVAGNRLVQQTPQILFLFTVLSKELEVHKDPSSVQYSGKPM